jgi:pyruvate dehydrogenase E1 component alpha subunit
MDPVAVREAVQEARARAVSGEGPTLIEATTYRYRGHDMGDPQNYRTKDEMARWREQDPIERLARALGEAGVLDDQARASLARSVAGEIAEARRAGLEADPAPVSAAFDYVYADGGEV